MTPEVYLCWKSSASATAATWPGSPRRTSTPSRTLPAASSSPSRYWAAARTDPVPRAMNVMCIVGRVADAGELVEGLRDVDQVGDDLDRVDGLGVGVCPACDLVQVVADARDLAGALALGLGSGRGPGAGVRHSLAQQVG